MDGDLEQLLKSQDDFDSLKTAKITPVFTLLPKPSVTSLRSRTQEPGSATVTSDGSEITVSTGTDTNSVATLDTQQWGRYIPGAMGIYGIRIQIPTQPTGDAEVRFGPFNDSNGVIFGQDATGPFALVRNGGTDGSKRRYDNLPDWFDLQDGLIMRDLFSYYGEGAWHKVAVKGDGASTKRNEIDSFVPSGGGPLIEQPNLPIRCEVDNGTTGTDFTANVIGRQFHIVGDYKPSRRKIRHRNFGVSVGTTPTNVMNWQFKNDFRNVEVKMEKVSILAGAEDIEWDVFFGTSVSGATFSDPDDYPAGESPVQVDTAGTHSGGVPIDGDLTKSANKTNNTANSEANLEGISVPKHTNVSLVARSISGSSTTADFQMKLQAEM